MATNQMHTGFFGSEKTTKNKVLIAPLNWGLGHASRCIPVIQFLLRNNFTPVIASDGAALELLKKEFPELQTIQLPAYNIRYAKFAFWTKWRLLFSLPSIYKAVQGEQDIVKKEIDTNSYVGIISDNRFGVYSNKIPSVYITHQLQVFSGLTTFFTSKVHQKIISKFDVCWVPDGDASHSLSGELSKTIGVNIPIEYLGNLSRLTFQKQEKQYDVVLLLSGPEPQRSLLETIFLKQFENFEGKVLLVQGLIEAEEKREIISGIEVVNFLTSEAMQKVLNSADLVVTRSGYSSMMDLEKLHKKVFFIPTPGQEEQQYLAKNLEQKKIAPFCQQEQFTIDKLLFVKEYSGFEKEYECLLHPKILKVFKAI